MPKLPAEQPSAEMVELFLTEHPEFLAERPKLAAKLAHKLTNGGNVADFRQFLMDRLHEELAVSQEALAELVVLSRDHLAQLEQMHLLVIRLMQAERLDDILDAMTDYPPSLMIDVMVLAIEADIATELDALETPVKAIAVGTVKHELGDGLSRIDHMPPPDTTLFGPATGLVQAYALMRLDVPALGRPAMLAIGTRMMECFSGAHGAILWRFLARALECQLDRFWHEMG